MLVINYIVSQRDLSNTQCIQIIPSMQTDELCEGCVGWVRDVCGVVRDVCGSTRDVCEWVRDVCGWGMCVCVFNWNNVTRNRTVSIHLFIRQVTIFTSQLPVAQHNNHQFHHTTTPQLHLTTTPHNHTTQHPPPSNFTTTTTIQSAKVGLRQVK